MYASRWLTLSASAALQCSAGVSYCFRWRLRSSTSTLLHALGATRPTKVFFGVQVVCMWCQRSKIQVVLPAACIAGSSRTPWGTARPRWRAWRPRSWRCWSSAGCLAWSTTRCATGTTWAPGAPPPWHAPLLTGLKVTLPHGVAELLKTMEPLLTTLEHVGAGLGVGSAGPPRKIQRHAPARC